MPRPITFREKHTLSADETLPLGFGERDVTAAWVVQLSLAGGATVDVQHKVGNADDWLDAPYINRADPETVIAAATTISASGIYQIDAFGVQVRLVFTANGGTGEITIDRGAG